MRRTIELAVGPIATRAPTGCALNAICGSPLVRGPLPGRLPCSPAVAAVGRRNQTRVDLARLACTSSSTPGARDAPRHLRRPARVPARRRPVPDAPYVAGDDGRRRLPRLLGRTRRQGRRRRPLDDDDRGDLVWRQSPTRAESRGERESRKIGSGIGFQTTSTVASWPGISDTRRSLVSSVAPSASASAR